MAEITSFTPFHAFSTPGSRPQRSPPKSPAATQTSQWIPDGSSRKKAAAMARYKPTVYWPATPILNNPALNTNPTESPVISIGAARYNICPISLTSNSTTCPFLLFLHSCTRHGKPQFLQRYTARLKLSHNFSFIQYKNAVADI